MDTSSFQHGINLPKKQTTMTQHQPVSNQVSHRRNIAMTTRPFCPLFLMQLCGYLPFFSSVSLSNDLISIIFKLDLAIIEKLVDKVIGENPDMIRSFRTQKRRQFAHLFLGGMVCATYGILLLWFD